MLHPTLHIHGQNNVKYYAHPTNLANGTSDKNAGAFAYRFEFRLDGYPISLARPIRTRGSGFPTPYASFFPTVGKTNKSQYRAWQ